jgi:hypothetical protein
MREPYVIAERLLVAMMSVGFKCDVVGGIYKKKPSPHDIDIIVEGNGNNTEIDLLSKCALSIVKDIKDEDRVPIEFYIADVKNYLPLRDALRAHRYQIIRDKMMSGLRFRKFCY